MNSDTELLLKAAQRLDEDALNAIFDKFADSIYEYSVRSCRDSTVAERIVGDVFGQLLEQFATGHPPIISLRTYLYKIAYQLLLNHSSANPQSALIELTLSPYEGEQSDEQVMMQELISTINTELTYEQRHVIVLRFLEDFSLAETSEILDQEANKVRVIQNTAIRKLRKAMGIDNAWSYSHIINTFLAILPRTLNHVTSLLASRKTENIEGFEHKETKLYVGNLAYDMYDSNLLNLFSRAGTVKSVQVFRDSESNQSTSSACVVMSSLEEAIRAMYMFHRREFDGRSLAVKIGGRPEEESIDEDLFSGSNQSNERRLRVFLCHAHKDALAVKAVYERLVNSNIDAWLDKEKLLPGSDWEHEIRRAVRTSDIVIVCLSNGFDQKGFRQKEVRIALEESTLQPAGEIFIIPARLEECEILPSLRHLHWVNLFEPEGYEKLLRTLKMRALKIGAIL